MHIEFERPLEAFGLGQPEAYPLSAACFARTHAQRATLNPHQDWATIISCGDEATFDPRLSQFQRVITHREAKELIRACSLL